MPEQWSCGHYSNGMCGECYRNLARQAADLVAQRDRMEKSLQDILAWERAYPLKVFPKPDLKEAATILKMYSTTGTTLDAISAEAMRHVLAGVANLARDGLRNE